MGSRPYRAVFRCIAGCEGDHSIWRPIYRCPRCGDLLRVAHDMAALTERSPAAWMRLFDDRYKRTSWPYGSGVWGKRSGSARKSATKTSSRWTRAARDMLWADRAAVTSA